MDLRQAAWYSAVPWSVMAFVGYLAGMSSDFLIQGGTSISLTRKLMQVGLPLPLFFHVPFFITWPTFLCCHNQHLTIWETAFHALTAYMSLVQQLGNFMVAVALALGLFGGN